MVATFLCTFLLLPHFAYGSDEFSFELDEIEKKPYRFGGYLELRGEHMDINQGSVFTGLNFADPDMSTMDLMYGSIQLDGSYEYGISSLNVQLKAAAQQDTIGWSDLTVINSAYIALQPAPSATFHLEKNRINGARDMPGIRLVLLIVVKTLIIQRMPLKDI